MKLIAQSSAKWITMIVETLMKSKNGKGEKKGWKQFINGQCSKKDYKGLMYECNFYVNGNKCEREKNCKGATQ